MRRQIGIGKVLESIGKVHESQAQFRNFEESRGKPTVLKKVPGNESHHAAPDRALSPQRGWPPAKGRDLCGELTGLARDSAGSKCIELP